MNKTKILRLFLSLLLLMTVGVKVAWGWGETVYYLQNYNTSYIDWSTSVPNRFTPIIVNDGGNLYLAGDPSETYNNGATLTGPDMHVPAGADFVLTFDLKLGNSNDDKPKFWINGADGNDMFTVEAQYTNGNHPWIINNFKDVPISLPGTNYLNTNTINDRPWNHFKLTSKNGTLHLIIEAADYSTVLDHDIEIINSTGGIGRFMFRSGKALAKFAIDNIRATSLFSYDAASATVPLTAVGTWNHQAVTGLPTIINETGTSGTITYSSSNTSVARVDNSGNVYLVGTGTTGITATMGNYSTSYELTVTGTNAPTSINTSISAGITTKTWSLTGEGIMPKGSIVDIGAITMSYGVNTEMGVVVNDGGTNVMKVIDGNGYSHAAVNTTTHLPEDPSYGGTIYTFRPVANGTLTINGKFSKPRLYNSDGTGLVNNDNYETSVTANLTANNVYYFYCEPWERALLSSFSYAYQAYLTKSYDVVPSTSSSYAITSVEGLSNPSYNIIATAGNITMGDVSISGNTITGFNNKPGAVKIRISEGGTVFYFVLTVAYSATPYPGKLWDFNVNDENQASLKIYKSDVTAGKGFPRIDARSEPAITYEGNEGGDATGYSITDNLGGTWVARNKNVNANSGRDARWRYANAVHGDNAFVIEETAGLVFNTGGEGFFIRNDRLAKDAPVSTPDNYKGQSCWSHVGIRQNGSSFTIPCLNAGDVIEINWKRESGGAGGIFEATNASDLRNIEVTKHFEITGSQIGTTGGVTDFHKNPGLTSFKATANGDVTFTLRDGGATDILAIRIYSGDYLPTMRAITSRDNHTVNPVMLVDNNYSEYAYNYCNVLNSTNTGPAMYVLKGWRYGTDDEESVTGTDASRNIVNGSPVYTLHTDIHAYEVTDANEEARLYDLRKNLIGFRLWNYNWVSSRNAYNDGRVGAQGGWGKVTFRMNNYTNFIDESDGTKGVYLIGYTPDCTLTIGSAPHQKYPYTWDFSKIAGGTVTGRSDNVLYSIEEEGSLSAYNGEAPTNWIKKDNGQFVLNTDNSGETGSQYVPGAVLVTTERALSNYSVPEDKSAVYAKDELDGLGFAGDITMHIEHLPTGVNSGWNRDAVTDIRKSLLSFKLTDYVVFTQTGGTDDEPEGTWSFSTEEQDAGNGIIQLNENCKIHESSIPAGKIGYQLDGGNTKYICIKLNDELQAGDIISITAYNIYSQNTGISFYNNKKDQGGNLLKTIDFNSWFMEETISYPVVNNDHLEGEKTLYLYRKDNATIHITAIEITRSASTASGLDWSIYTLSRTTVTVPDLNADGKQDWIYVSATSNPRRVVNYDTSGTNEIDLYQVADAAGGGPDANTNVYKYKVAQPGNVNLIFDEETKIYKIGVTHILKGIHSVGDVGWATESRDHNIDHELTGYFTVNDVNAYTVKYDSYDMKTATVALTPVIEDGYVVENTGIVLRLDNGSTENGANLSKANSEEALYRVPLFYPSYTRGASSTSTTFSPNNLMYPNLAEATHQFENAWLDDGTYTKFILTNTYWTFDKDHTLYKDESATSHTANATGFYRMHIWKTTSDKDNKNTMAANTAYLLVPSDNLPAAAWTLQDGYSPARGNNILGVYNIVGPGSETAVDDIELTPGVMMNANDVDGEETWYSVSGMKLSERPTKVGLYIHNNKKVVIK